MAVADATGNRFHQLSVGDAVEVTAQVGVDHLAVAGVDQGVDLPDGVQTTTPRAVTTAFPVT